MNVRRLHNLYPTFLMEGILDELSERENRVLADYAWENQSRNANKKLGQGDDIGIYYNATKRANIFVDHRSDPTVKKFAAIADKAVREYIWAVFRYRSNDRIEMQAEAFCQNRETGTNGIWTHAHPLRPIVFTYYPVYSHTPRASTSTSSGVNGEANFYDPTCIGKRVVPNYNNSFHMGSTFQLQIKAGMFLVFEGHVPHDSAAFDGDERVCIPVLCNPVLSSRNMGCTLEDLL